MNRLIVTTDVVHRRRDPTRRPCRPRDCDRAPAGLRTVAVRGRARRRSLRHAQRSHMAFIGSTITPRWRLEESGAKDRGLIELFAECDSVELWMGPEPNEQLILLWLLDYLRDAGDQWFPKLVLRPAGHFRGRRRCRSDLATFIPPTVKLTQDHLESGRSCVARLSCGDAARLVRSPKRRSKSAAATRSVRAGACSKNFRMCTTGLGATEMRMLEFIALDDVQPFDVFPGDQKRNERRVFGYWEVGALLDGLARCPEPAISGLEEGPFSLEMHNDRSVTTVQQEQLSLTQLGKAMLARDRRFSSVTTRSIAGGAVPN